jgi:predicted nucleic acid-binding Zn finger protein
MNQLAIVHKKIPKKNASKLFTGIQKTEQIGEELENKREGHGRNIALTKNVFYLSGSKHVYYVQSEHSNERYYYVKFIPSVFEYCSCPDNSIRGQKCKHQFAIEYAIRKNTLKEIEHLPENTIRYPQVITAKDYREQRMEDEYSF